MREIFYILLGMAIGLAVLSVPAYLVRKVRCEAQAISFDEHDYGLIKGCMVKYKGKWIPLKNIRGFGDY